MKAVEKRVTILNNTIKFSCWELWSERECLSSAYWKQCLHSGSKCCPKAIRVEGKLVGALEERHTNHRRAGRESSFWEKHFKWSSAKQVIDFNEMKDPFTFPQQGAQHYSSAVEQRGAAMFDRGLIFSQLQTSDLVWKSTGSRLNPILLSFLLVGLVFVC